jgi:hypothetical protein
MTPVVGSGAGDTHLKILSSAECVCNRLSRRRTRNRTGAGKGAGLESRNIAVEGSDKCSVSRAWTWRLVLAVWRMSVAGEGRRRSAARGPVDGADRPRR